MNDQNEESGIYYYHADHLGSSSVVTDKNGKFHEHLEFFPYGETWINDRANNEDLPYRFTGKELDPETGLYFYGARYYDVKLSRWISADPILKDYLPKNDFFRKNDKHIEKYFNSVYKRKPEKEDVQSFTAQKYFVLSYDIIDIKDLKGIGGICNVVNLNLYTYCANNPVRFVDPDGNEVYVFYDVIVHNGKIVSCDAYISSNRSELRKKHDKIIESRDISRSSIGTDFLSTRNLINCGVFKDAAVWVNKFTKLSHFLTSLFKDDDTKSEQLNIIKVNIGEVRGMTIDEFNSYMKNEFEIETVINRGKENE